MKKRILVLATFSKKLEILIIKIKVPCPKKILLSLKSSFTSTDFSKISILKLKEHNYINYILYREFYLVHFLIEIGFKKYILHLNSFRSKKKLICNLLI